MALGPDVAVGGLDPARGIDDKSGSDQPLVLTPIVALGPPGAQRRGEPMFNIREKGERKVVGPPKLLVPGGRIGADAEDGEARRLEDRGGVAKVTGLGRTPRRERLGIEEEDDWLPAVILERGRLTVVAD